MIDMGRLPPGRQFMMGQREFGPKLYYQFSLERLIPDDHLLRRIAERVDFSFIRRLCRPYYSHTGQPSVDPVVLFKLLLVGYLYGITSERRLAEEVRLNLAYRWFLGYDLDESTPDHSVLSKLRARLPAEVFEGFFQRSIELCREVGLLSEGPVYVDSTLIQAAASVDSLAATEEQAPPLSVSEYVRRLYLENDPPAEQPRDEPEPPTETPSSDSGTGGAARSEPLNRALQSTTDPEATLVNRPAFGRHLAWKAHVAVAGKRGQVITAAVATTGAEADEHLLRDVLWHHRRLSRLGVPAVVADAKYGTGPNYLFLGERGIPAFIPTTRFGHQHKGIWGHEHFQWLLEEDAFLCPAGQKLRRASNATRTTRVRYQAPKGVCPTCPFRADCAPTGIARSVHRSWGQDYVDAAAERLASPLGKQRMVERKIFVEGTFGLAKELHGLRRTRFRGRQRVQVQLWLTAAAMNIKKAVRAGTRTGLPFFVARFFRWSRAAAPRIFASPASRPALA
jgi:transposase